jgi:hypothetical protein
MRASLTETTRAVDACAWRHLLARYLGVALLLVLVGCAGGTPVNPSLTITDDTKIDEATKRGISVINSGADPYQLFSNTSQDANVRIGSNVILRSAALCLPKDELAFRVAKHNDATEDGAKQAAQDALNDINTRVHFVAVLQTTKGRDPTSVKFQMATPSGQIYPALALEKPEFIRDIVSSSDIPATTLYGYNVYFQSTGSPGYPALDTSASALTLIIQDSGAEARLTFTVPAPPVTSQ